MSDQVGSYQVVDLSPGRRLMINMLDLSGPAHNMYGLLEVDVTIARQFIEEHKARTGETLSFTGFLTLCLACAVDEHKEVQAYLKGRKQLVLFDDVDVGMMIEGKIGDKRALMGHVILAVVLFVSAVLFVVGIPSLIAGIGLLKQKSWARILAIVLAILALASFPIGKAAGLYTLWVLTHRETEQLLGTAV